MIAALFLTLVPPSPSQAPLEPGDVQARFFCHPEKVEVGQPFRLILDFSHPPGTSVFDALENELELDDTWVVLGEERRASEPDPDDAARRRTRRAWTIASLEPGDPAPRVLSEALSRLIFSESVQRIETSLAVIDVTSVLGESNDPRPMAAFPNGFGRDAPILERSPWIVYTGLAMAALWALFLVLLLLRFKRKPRLETRTPPIQELRALIDNPPEGAEAMREKLYDLTALMRRSFEDEVGTRSGLTDREWLEAIRGTKYCTPAALEHMTRLVDDAERYKYAGSTPSDWALSETYDSARRVVDALQSAAAAKATEEAA